MQTHAIEPAWKTYGLATDTPARVEHAWRLWHEAQQDADHAVDDLLHALEAQEQYAAREALWEARTGLSRDDEVRVLRAADAVADLLEDEAFFAAVQAGNSESFYWHAAKMVDRLRDQERPSDVY